MGNRKVGSDLEIAQSAKLKHIDAWNDNRRKWAARYTAGLKDCKTFDLPIELPNVDEYKPTDDGTPPLGRASPDWLRVRLKDGRMGTRELNTMPQWAGSCWYYLRYCDPKNTERFIGEEAEAYWLGGSGTLLSTCSTIRCWHCRSNSSSSRPVS